MKQESACRVAADASWAAIVVGSVLSMAGGGASLAQEALQNQGWTVACASDGRCEMRYTQATEGREVSHLLIYSVGEETIVEYLVPLGVNLRKGIVLQIDGQHSFPTEAVFCDSPGCVGMAPLTPALLTRLKSGKGLKLAFSPRGSDEFYSFDYSLMGFTSQYNAFLAGGPAAAEQQ